MVLGVDDDVIEPANELHLLLRDLESPRNLLVRLGATGEQSFAKMREPVRDEKDQHGVRIRRLHRESAVDLRLHDNVVALAQAPLDVITWRPVKVAAVLAPLQETALVAALLELPLRNEEIMFGVAFLEAGGACGGRDRVPHAG